MAEFHEGTGVIMKTSSDSCDVSVTIDDTSLSISFSKSIFFTFGVPCEGRMTNILEDGMEVELCYRMFSPGRKPTLVAVWLGEKPDDLTKAKSSPKALYDSKGHIVSSVEDDFLVQDGDSNLVYINKGVAFQDGSPLNDSLIVDQEVTFDAIPFKYEHPSGASHQATCAWIGPKPRLVDRFDLRSTKLDSGLCGGDIVEGTVAVIPNNVVALVDVLLESTSIKVFVFRNSFKTRCARIGDAIRIGDILSLRLAYKLVFPGRKLWYAVQVAENWDELCFHQEGSPDSLLQIDCKPPCYPADELTEMASKPVCYPADELTEMASKPVCNLAPNQCVTFDRGPEILSAIPPLSGVISLVRYYYGACITCGNIKILVPRDDFYMGGYRCSDIDFMYYVGPGRNIAFFEAILLPDPTNRGYSYQATCAWVGPNQKPTVLVQATSLCRPNPYLLGKSSTFVGLIVKYLSPFSAFAFIPYERTFVLIDVGNFVSQPRYLPLDQAGVYITNYVKLNDAVQFNLQVNPHFPELFLTYNIRYQLPVGTSGEIIPNPNEQSNSYLPAQARFDFSTRPGLQMNPDPNEQVDLELQKKVNSVQKSLPSQKQSRKKTKKNAVKKASTVKETVVKNCTPPLKETVAKTPVKMFTPPPRTFRKESVSINQGFLLNCFGSIIVELTPKGIVVKIKHVFGTSKVNLTKVGFLPHDLLLNSDDMLKLNGVDIRFDAEFIVSNRHYQVLRLWENAIERPDSECLLASSLARWERLFVNLSGDLEAREMFYTPACIHSVPLHDSGIATIDQTKLLILVPLESLSLAEEISSKISSLKQVLSVGDKIFAKVVKRDFNGIAYYRTEKCFLGSDFPGDVNSDAEFERCGPKRISLSTIWGFGGRYLKGTIVFENDEYCLLLKKSQARGVDTRFNLFEKGRVYVQGQLANSVRIGEHIGEECSAHFAREYPDSESRKKLFIAWAWIGEPPPAQLMLKDTVSVPRGLVSSQWRYLVVVASFPLPSCALCYIGDVPVLFRSSRFDVPLADVVKVGDQFIVEVEEMTVEDSVVIISDFNNAVKASECLVKDVYRNLTGTISTRPEPTGKIQVADADFEVDFELCHVRSFETSGRWSLEEWLNFVSDEVAVGRLVCFSATKVKSGNVSYRAFEVYLID